MQRTNSTALQSKLTIAYRRLEEFLNNGIGLSSSMGNVIPKLENTEMIDVVLWNQFLKKFIERCKIIHERNPFCEAQEYLPNSPTNFTLVDYQNVVDSIFKQTFNHTFNSAFKHRAESCIWVVIFLKPLFNSQLKVNHLSSELITPFQRVTRLSLYSKDIKKDFEAIGNTEEDEYALPHDFDSLENQFQKFCDRSLLVSNVINQFQKVIDNLFELAKLSKTDFDLFLLKQEESISEHIESVVTLILNNEIKEKLVLQYVNNIFTPFLSREYQAECESRASKIMIQRGLGGIVVPPQDKKVNQVNLKTDTKLNAEDDKNKEEDKDKNEFKSAPSRGCNIF